MPNRLALASSPYLRQHADNPVDWYPWSAEALERARAERKPILLSVGYAACHWCHVMAHESFENPATAAVMNEHFVNIKVDREERPDIDAIYMQSVIALTGHGGWPMTVFLTPDGEPFYGGTYYPPQDRHGMPSFTRVLRAIADAWHNQPADVAATARQLRDVLARAAQPRESSGEVDRRTLDTAYRALAGTFDPRNGGFGDAPKFPPSMALDFLLRYSARTGQAHALEMVTQTFRAMSRGGVYDQLGGGLHRYSVDALWLVPHFEKMLYDNALFARLGVHLWQVTRDDEVRLTVERTLDWVLRDMRSPEGAFYSSLDADSEGHEGTFYLWDDGDFDRLLGEEAAIVRQHWGVSPHGNFEGRNILHVPQDVRATAARSGRTEAEITRLLEQARAVLLAERDRRVRPGLDDKVLASWNGLMVRALSEAARVFGRDDYREAALAAGRFLADVLVRDGRVLRAIRQGVSSGEGVLEDYAAVGLAFLDLYALTFDRAWFVRARQLAEATVDLFFDEETRAFFDTARDHEALIVRPRDVADNALPSGNSLAAELLLRVADLGEIARWRDLAAHVVHQSSDLVAQAPNFFGHLLGVADALVFGSVQVAIAGAPSEAAFQSLEARLRDAYVPSLIVAGGTPEGAEDPVALLRGRGPRDGRASAYVCRHFVCEAPTSEPSELAAQLAAATSP